MADPAPTRESTARSDGFYDTAKAAGVDMQRALEGNSTLSKSRSNLAWSSIDEYQKILEPVMNDFEKDVFEQRHPVGGKLIWAKVYVANNDFSFDGSMHSSKQGDFWVLVLAVVDEDTIGVSLNLKTRQEIKKGSILLGYEITGI